MSPVVSQTSVQDLEGDTQDSVLAPVVVEEEYTMLMTVPLRSLPVRAQAISATT